MVKLVEMVDGEAMVELAKVVLQVVVLILVRTVVKRRIHVDLEEEEEQEVDPEEELCYFVKVLII